MNLLKSSRSTVLVIGGTGQQGGAVVRQLLQAGQVNIRVLTRNPHSDAAARLAARGVQLYHGDLGDSRTVARALEDVSAAFLVQTFLGRGGIRREIEQGLAFADAVRDAGSPHLVYSSVDGAERSSGVPHFESKWKVEQHIRALELPATILRPVAFMENMKAPGFPRRMFLGLLRAAMGSQHRLQLVAVDDLGWFAARALEAPESYRNRIIPIAGDELSVDEMTTVWRGCTGETLKPAPLPRFFVKLLPKDFSSMLRWFETDGYTVDIPAVRKEHAGLMKLAEWITKRDLAVSAALPRPNR